MNRSTCCPLTCGKTLIVEFDEYWTSNGGQPSVSYAVVRAPIRLTRVQIKIIFSLSFGLSWPSCARIRTGSRETA